MHASVKSHSLKIREGFFVNFSLRGSGCVQKACPLSGENRLTSLLFLCTIIAQGLPGPTEDISQREGVQMATSEKKRDASWTVRASYALFGLTMAAVLAVCLGFSWMAYSYKRGTLSNGLLLPAGLAALALMLPLPARGIRRLRASGRLRAAWLGTSLVLLAVQIVMIDHYYFYTDWDVQTIVESAMAMVTGEDISRHSNYFSMYPNNLVLVTLQSWIFRAASLLGLWDRAYFLLLVFQCVLCWATGLLLCRIVRTLTGSDGLTAAAYTLYQLLVGLNPWVSIPYSDAVALFFPTAILAVELTSPKRPAARVLKGFLVAFLSFFGYRIKPQVLLVFIAILLMRAAKTLRRGLHRLRAAQLAREAACMGTGALCAVLLANAMAASVPVTINPEQEMGIAHYLMMGMNPESFGGYAQQDVSLSWRCGTRAERTRTNLQVLSGRLQEMGPTGLVKQVLRKTLTNYNDGTFCWAGEGVFYRELLPEKDGVLSPLLRSIYYSHEGALYPAYANVVQALWMGVLALCAAASLGRQDERAAVLMLTLLALTLFETLFEARARYLFSFAPLYIALAACGIQACRERCARLRKSVPSATRA